MGLFDRLKKAKDVLVEPSQINEDAFMQDPEAAKAGLGGEGLVKLFRAGAEILPDANESSIPLDPNDPNSMRFDPSGMIGGVKNIARELGPAAEAVRSAGYVRIPSAQHGDILKQVFTGIQDSAKSEQLANALKKLGHEVRPDAGFGRVIIKK